MCVCQEQLTSTLDNAYSLMQLSYRHLMVVLMLQQQEQEQQQQAQEQVQKAECTPTNQLENAGVLEMGRG